MPITSSTDHKVAMTILATASRYAAAATSSSTPRVRVSGVPGSSTWWQDFQRWSLDTSRGWDLQLTLEAFEIQIRADMIELARQMQRRIFYGTDTGDGTST